MKIKNLITILLSVATLSPCCAQSADEIKRQINAVKKKPNIYLYAEATAMTEEEARGLAEELLYDEINNWVVQQKKLKASERLMIANKKNIMDTLTVMRGNMFRCFLYVKKSDISGAESVEVIDNIQEKPVAKPVETSVYPEIVREVAGITNYNSVDSRLKQAKVNGEIADYANDTFPAQPENYYFVIYNGSGTVLAVLTPGTERKNIRTGETDSLTNYKGCKAVGFKL